MRLLYLVLALSLFACGGKSPAPSGPDPSAAPDGAPRAHARTGLGCYIEDQAAADACNARTAEGCSMSPPLHCMGIPPSPEQEEEWRREAEEESVACECICQEQIQRCAEVP